MTHAIPCPKLFAAGKIGMMQLRNRVVMAPMVVQLGAESGAVTQRTVDYYARRAKGGAGLVIVEATYVAPGGKAFACQLSIDRDALVPGHFDLVEAIHRNGAKVALQIHHGGARANPALTGGVLVAPSAVAEEGISTVPRALTAQEIEDLADSYARAALRAQRAGYDAVEIHGAHGYLIHGFLSPVSNHRTDAYGGSAENRLRFAGLVVRRVREAVGARFPVLFRMSAEGGYGISEAVEIARALDHWAWTRSMSRWAARHRSLWCPWTPARWRVPRVGSPGTQTRSRNASRCLSSSSAKSATRVLRKRFWFKARPTTLRSHDRSWLTRTGRPRPRPAGTTRSGTASPAIIAGSR